MAQVQLKCTSENFLSVHVRIVPTTWVAAHYQFQYN